MHNWCREGRAASPEARERQKTREAWQVGDTAPDLIELKLHNAVELHLITRRWTETLHRRLRVHSIRLRCEYLGLKTSTCAPRKGRERGLWSAASLPCLRSLEKRLLGQTPSDPNGAAWRTIPCSRRAIGRGSTSARTLSTPELDQLRGHTRKVWPDDRGRRPPRHRQCGRRSIAGSRDKRRRTANVLRPEIIPHMGRHHANRSRRYKQLLRGHVVDLRRTSRVGAAHTSGGSTAL